MRKKIPVNYKLLEYTQPLNIKLALERKCYFERSGPILRPGGWDPRSVTIIEPVALPLTSSHFSRCVKQRTIGTRGVTYHIRS